MADRISIAMCTFNGERYLREQLDSIATQTRLPDEVVVCDDHSTDATREIVTAFAVTAPFLVNFHVNEQNVGSTKNFERAIRLCEGDVIALSDQDDVWLPEKLGRIEECFLRNPTVGMVFTDAIVVDEALQPLGYSLWESVGFDNTQRRLVRTGRAFDVLLAGTTVTGTTMAFRSKFRDLVLDIPNNLVVIHDGWIALMIASVADVWFIEEPLIKYRQHGRQQIGATKTDEAVATGLSDLKKSVRRTTSYTELIEIAKRARARLIEHGDTYKSEDALLRLETRLKHLRARAHLPEGKLNRVRCVLEELLSRRYHLYSNGFRSAVKDLLT